MSVKTLPGRALTDYLYAKASRMRVPISGTFELSPVCNFSCKMCYIRKTPKEVRENPRGMITLNQWRRIAREAREAGLLELLLTGGEPLLWPDFWKLYEELVDMGMLVSINTNGSLIDDDAIDRFRKKPPQKINITLYGANDETYQRLCGVSGVFSKVDRAIRGLKEAGISVKLNCSLTPDNADDLDWIVDYALKWDITLALATYMFPPVRRDSAMIGVNERFTPQQAAAYMLRYMRRDRGETRYRSYLKNILEGYADPPGLESECVDPVDGKVRCRAGKASFWITWDGWMMPCGMMPVPKVDVAEKSFRTCWNQITEETASLRLSGVCSNCPNRNICHPCAAIAYAETGSVCGIPIYKCQAVREMCRIAEEQLLTDDIDKKLPGGNEKI